MEGMVVHHMAYDASSNAVSIHSQDLAVGGVTTLDTSRAEIDDTVLTADAVISDAQRA